MCCVSTHQSVDPLGRDVVIVIVVVVVVVVATESCKNSKHKRSWYCQSITTFLQHDCISLSEFCRALLNCVQVDTLKNWSEQFHIVVDPSSGQQRQMGMWLDAIDHVPISFEYIYNFPSFSLPNENISTITARNYIFITPKVDLFNLEP